MKSLTKLTAVLLLLATQSLLAQDDDRDIEGGKDHPLFTRLTGFAISRYEEKDFDRAEMSVPAGKSKSERELKEIEGKVTRIHYHNKKGVKASRLQVARNYINAAKKAGGEIVFNGDGKEWYFQGGLARSEDVTIKFAKDGKEIWANVSFDGSYLDPDLAYFLTIVEATEMKQDITASSEMLDALNKAGRVALYINFDTGKDIIKPESQAIVSEIVKLLKENPSLNLSIEGHTDNTGDPAGNQRLSEMRAAAVVSALVSQGVDKKRLTAVGFGRQKPIADNNSDDGRAKNRRVELVKK